MPGAGGAVAQAPVDPQSSRVVREDAQRADPVLAQGPPGQGGRDHAAPAVPSQAGGGDDAGQVGHAARLPLGPAHRGQVPGVVPPPHPADHPTGADLGPDAGIVPAGERRQLGRVLPVVQLLELGLPGVGGGRGRGPHPVPVAAVAQVQDLVGDGGVGADHGDGPAAQTVQVSAVPQRPQGGADVLGADLGRASQRGHPEPSPLPEPFDEHHRSVHPRLSRQRRVQRPADPGVTPGERHQLRVRADPAHVIPPPRERARRPPPARAPGAASPGPTSSTGPAASSWPGRRASARPWRPRGRRRPGRTRSV